MLEKEMISLFSNTFKAPYFEYLVRSSAQHFTDLVVIAERIEQTIGLGKIADPTEKKGFTEKGKDTEGGCQGTYRFYIWLQLTVEKMPLSRRMNDWKILEIPINDR